MVTALNTFLTNIDSLFGHGYFVERSLSLFMILSIQLLTKMKVSIWTAVVVIIQLFNLTVTCVLRPLVKYQNYLLFNMPGPGLIKQQEDIGKNKQGVQNNKKIERMQRCLIYESFNQKIGLTEFFEGYAICPDMIFRMVKRTQVNAAEQNKLVSKMKHLLKKQVKKSQKISPTIEISQIKTKKQKYFLSQQLQNKKLKKIDILKQPSITLLPRLQKIITQLTQHREQSPRRILETCTNGSCIPQFCGDGVVNQNGIEKCDDGNNVEKDGCTNCIDDYCGDGIVNQNGAEQCDDGNNVNGDGCTNCIKDYCGDGVVNQKGQKGAEQCDDGNNISTDGCTNCIEDCGNGVIQSAEECDDGNQVSGDGCDQYCYNQQKRVLLAVFGTIGGVAVIAVVLGIIFGKFGGGTAAGASAGASANSLQTVGVSNFYALAEAEPKKYIA